MPRKKKQDVKTNDVDSLENKCIKCHETKPLCEFTKCKTSRNGHRNTCKSCTNLNKNNDKYKASQKIYREKNLEKKRNYMMEYNSKQETKDRIKKWHIENKDSINKKRRAYKKTIPHIIGWRNLINHTVTAFKTNKNGNTYELLGYSALELKEHIEYLFTDGMSWDNYGEWHIDHITPMSWFTSDTPPSIVNSLSNLKPMWGTTREINGVIYIGNLNKNNKFII